MLLPSRRALRPFLYLLLFLVASGGTNSVSVLAVRVTAAASDSQEYLSPTSAGTAVSTCADVQLCLEGQLEALSAQYKQTMDAQIETNLQSVLLPRLKEETRMALKTTIQEQLDHQLKREIYPDLEAQLRQELEAFAHKELRKYGAIVGIVIVTLAVFFHCSCCFCCSGAGYMYLSSLRHRDWMDMYQRDCGHPPPYESFGILRLLPPLHYRHSDCH